MLYFLQRTRTKFFTKSLKKQLGLNHVLSFFLCFTPSVSTKSLSFSFSLSISYMLRTMLYPCPHSLLSSGNVSWLSSLLCLSLSLFDAFCSYGNPIFFSFFYITIITTTIEFGSARSRLLIKLTSFWYLKKHFFSTSVDSPEDLIHTLCSIGCLTLN